MSIGCLKPDNEDPTKLSVLLPEQGSQKGITETSICVHQCKEAGDFDAAVASALKFSLERAKKVHAGISATLVSSSGRDISVCVPRCYLQFSR